MTVFRFDLFMNTKIAFKIIITILLLLFVLIKLDIYEILSIFINSNIFLIAICLILVPALFSIRVFKWDVLLRSVGMKHTFQTLFRVSLIGIFYGMITPGKAGEIARAYYLKSDKSITVPTIICDKLIDILVLIILSALAILFFFSDANIYSLMVVLVLLFVLMTILLLNERIIYFLLSLIGADNQSKSQFIETLHSIRNDLRLLTKLILLSLCYYIFALILAVIILKSLSASIDLRIAFIYPIIVLMGNIPITISGFGLREYVTVLCFEELDQNPAIGFSFSILLFIFTTLIPGLAGYILLIRGKKR